MQETSVGRKGLAISIMVLVLAVTIAPFTAQGQTLGKNIITVDDEPGDADYTSIKEAVQHAGYGDTIEVYSGTYQEHDIDIAKPGLTLKGIPHELGNGDDTGKPVITSANNVTMLNVWGPDVTVTNFTIIDASPLNLATFPILLKGNNCTFSYNNVTGGWTTLSVGSDEATLPPFEIRIMQNTIEHSTIGIYFSGTQGNISHNVFRSCMYQAIEVFAQSTNTIISYNTISNCSTGILYYNGSDSTIAHNLISAGVGIDLETDNMDNITIARNELRQCRIGILLDFRQSIMRVQQNNFIGNGGDVKLIQTVWRTSTRFHPRIFDGNYYDTWKTGPKWIRGRAIIYIIPMFWGGEFFFVIPIWVPWFYRDPSPAQQPYDIGV